MRCRCRVALVGADPSRILWSASSSTPGSGRLPLARPSLDRDDPERSLADVGVVDHDVGILLHVLNYQA